MTFKHLFAILLVSSCVDAKQFGTSAGDKSQKRGDKSRQPIQYQVYRIPRYVCNRRWICGSVAVWLCDTFAKDFKVPKTWLGLGAGLGLQASAFGSSQ
jgi:hypothetical protein